MAGYMAGQEKAMLVANAPITATLRPVVSDSVGKDGTLGGFDSDNLYIEGDNLEVLKLLQETYLSKLKKRKRSADSILSL